MHGTKSPYIVNTMEPIISDLWVREQESLARLLAEHNSNYNLTEETKKKIKKRIRKTISHQIQMHHEILEAFFSQYSFPLLGYDSEEYYSRTVCLVALLIQPDLTFSCEIFSLEPKTLKYQSPKIFSQFAKWLEILPSNTKIVFHGQNNREQSLAQKSQKSYQNTQSVLKQAKSDQISPIPTKTGLSAWESFIDFKRIFCGFFKHLRGHSTTSLSKKERHKTIYSQTKHSLSLLAQKKEPRLCLICNKPQDLYGNCAEDAMVSLLIYACYIAKGCEVPLLPKYSIRESKKKNNQIENQILNVLQKNNALSETRLLNCMGILKPDDAHHVLCQLVLLLEEGTILKVGKTYHVKEGN